MSTLVFYSPEHKIMPDVSQAVIPKLKTMDIGSSVEFNGVKYTVCDISKIPDSRNKFGRLNNSVKCVLVK